jgi:drug/metabolite transporter (DMT)-like permease
MPFDYVRLPVVAFLGYVAFGDIPDLWTWVGGAVILASSVYVAHREAVQRRLAGAAAAAPGAPTGS